MVERNIIIIRKELKLTNNQYKTYLGEGVCLIIKW